MKKKLLLVLLLLQYAASFAQSYEKLEKLDGISSDVYFSSQAKERAVKIATTVARAETFFQKAFQIKPKYTLLVLSPADWMTYAHPNAIYGIPHYLPDGRLIVAAEDNEFWQRNTPPVDKIPQALAQQMKQTFGNSDGTIDVTDAFDLLAVHELGHAFQDAAGMTKQKNWLNELLCNVLLHTYLAENEPKSLPFITVFTNVSVASFPEKRLKYRSLEDFDNYYMELAKNHPDNYGWYQCRFHIAAGEIYDNGGMDAMMKMWSSLLAQKTVLSDAELQSQVAAIHPALEKVITDWNK